MKEIFFTFFLLLVSLNFYSQETILTKEKNATWIEELQQETNHIFQLEMIRERMSDDREVYFIATTNPHGKTRIPEEFENTTKHRPIYLLQTQDGKATNISPNPSEKYLETLQKLLQPENVIHIEILQREEQLLCGTRGQDGVIKIHVKDDKLVADLRELN